MHTDVEEAVAAKQEVKVSKKDLGANFFKICCVCCRELYFISKIIAIQKLTTFIKKRH